jgi:plasmid stabilization system protein ParE
MTPYRLAFSTPATADITLRIQFLSDQRGTDFGVQWSETFLSWLENLAVGGAIIGTRHPTRLGFRKFPFRGEATILAEYIRTELRIVRVYFAGQDWLA